MTLEGIRAFCLQMPHVTEAFKMHHAAFQIGGKTFALLNLDVEGLPLSFKCTPDDYAEAIEVEGLIPAPYLARSRWVSLTGFDALPASDLKDRLRRACEAVRLTLSKKAQAQLA